MRDRNKALLFKIETTIGVDAAPVASDAVAVENLRWQPNVNQIQTNESTGSLDTSASIVGGMRARLNFDVVVRGSGAAATAPQWGKLLQACSYKEVLTAAAVPAAPEACAAGSTTSATLGASAVGTAQLYRGMPVQITGTPSGANGIYPISNYTSGKVATLAALAGAAIAGTSSYQILPNALYMPTSAPADVKAGTGYFYKDGKLIKLLGLQGTWSLRVEAGGIGRFSFEFMGLFAGETDAAIPAGIVDPATVAPVWRGGRSLIDRSAAAVNSLQLSAGVALTMPGDPNASEGYQTPQATARTLAGRIDPLDDLVATRDTMADFRNGTPRILLAQWGSAAGNRFALTMPAAVYQDLNDGDREGVSARELPFRATGSDAGAFLCHF